MELVPAGATFLRSAARQNPETSPIVAHGLLGLWQDHAPEVQKSVGEAERAMAGANPAASGPYYALACSQGTIALSDYAVLVLGVGF